MGRVSNERKKTIIAFAKQHGSHRAADKFKQNEDTIRAWVGSERISNVAAKVIEKKKQPTIALKDMRLRSQDVTFNITSPAWNASITCTREVVPDIIGALAGFHK